MTKTRVSLADLVLPDEFNFLVSKSEIYDSSSSPEAKVYYLKTDGGYYLKRGVAGSLAAEAKMAEYFHTLNLSPRVLSYATKDGFDWLLSEECHGEDLTASMYLENPKKLCDTLAETLRTLHEKSHTHCPIKDRTASYFLSAERGYKSGKFDRFLFEGSTFAYDTPREAWDVFTTGKELLNGHVLLHGDYCLPNLIFDKWNFSGFIDLGAAGVGDRHVDIFWGMWTLNFNLKSNKYCKRFLDCYGRELINMDALRTVAAAECFG